MRKMPVQLTPAALGRIKEVLRENQATALRIKLRTRGCSGLSYVMEIVDGPTASDEVLSLEKEAAGAVVCVHKPALLFLTGTLMDYEETPTRKGFVFVNPKEKGRCGCGTSFHV